MPSNLITAADLGLHGSTADDAAAAVPEGNSFTQGLRSGATSAGGQLRALAGGVGEAVGANEFAAEQYAKSHAAQQLAAEQGPEVNSFKQVEDAYTQDGLRAGLRRGGQYVAGLAGQSAPAIGLGLGAAALTHGKGALPAFLAATGAVAPLEAGGAIERQQADPAAVANNSASKRLLTAAGEGLASSALQNAVPLAMGGKLLGHGVEGAAAKAFLPAAAENLSEAVAGNALAGAGAEKLHQATGTYLNENRDTSGDAEALKEAAIGGAALGLPFAAVGTAGAMRGARALGEAGSIKDRVLKATGLDGLERTDAPAPATARMKQIDDLGSVFNKDPVTGDDHAVAMGMADAPQEQHEGLFAEADRVAQEKAEKRKSKLLDDTHLTDLEKAELQTYPTDHADGQQALLDMDTLRHQRSRAAEAAKELESAVAPADEAGALRSEGGTTVPKQAYEALQAPEWSYLTDSAKQAAARALPRMVSLFEDGRATPVQIKALTETLGEGTRKVLIQLHDGIGSADETKRDNFYRAINQLTATQKREGGLLATVRESLPEDMHASVTTDQLNSFVNQYRRLTSEESTKRMTPQEALAHKTEVDDKLQEVFGDKYEQVRQAFMDDAEQTHGTKGLVDDRAVQPQDGPNALTETTNEELAATPRYYGKGKNADAPDFVEHMDVHRNKYDSESAHERLDGRARTENPDSSVSWMSAREYAKEHGIDDKTLHAMTDNRPDDHGLVVAEGTKQRDAVNWKDIDSMQLGRMKDGKREFSADYDSPSRIDTDSAGVILDARRIAKVMSSKLEWNDGEFSGSLQRLRRSFESGLAAVSDHLGEALHPDDDVVVAKRNGKDVTYGELKKLPVGEEQAETFAPSDTPPSELRKRLDAAQMKMDQIETSMKPLSDKEKGGTQLTPQEKRQLEKSREAWADQRRMERGYESALESRDSAERAQRVRDGVGLTEQDPGTSTKRAGETEELTGTARISPDNVHVDALLNKDTAVKFDEAGQPINYATKPTTSPEASAERMSGKIDKLAAKATTAAGKAVAERARSLFNHFDELSPTHQKDFIKALEAKKLSGAVESINALAERYSKQLTKPAKSPVEKAANWRARVESGEFTKEIAANIERNGSPKDLQQGLIPLLRIKNPNEHVKTTVEALNKRISTLLAPEKDSSTALNLQTKHAPEVMESKASTTGTKMSAADMKGVEDIVRKSLGNTVDLHLDDTLFTHAGEYQRMDPQLTRGLIRVSTHALDPLSVAHHESVHALFDQLRTAGLHDVIKPLDRAAKSAAVLDVLRERFAGSDAVLKQLEGSHEERVAYMYQLWAMKDKDMRAALTEPARNVFQRVWNTVLRTMGVWTNHERALHIMEYFQNGEYASNAGMRDVLSRALLEPGRNKQLDHVVESIKPLRELGSAMAVVGSQRVRDYENAALDRALNLIRPRSTDEGKDAGYITTSRVEASTRKNDMMQKLTAIGATREDMDAALAAMRLGSTTMTGKTAEVAKVFGGTLEDAFQYMKKAGVDIGRLSLKSGYAPRVWDTAYIAGHEKEFRAMVQKYVDTGAFKGNVEQLIHTLMGNEGGEIAVDSKIGPTNQHMKERLLKFISNDDAHPFLDHDSLRVMSSYLHQAGRRAEWARRFGDDNAVLDKIRTEAAQRYGATPDQLATFDKYVGGVNGTLGNTLSPKMRKVQDNMMVFENLRLLALGTFSAAIDANGIIVNNGSIGDAFKAFKRAVVEIRKSYQKDPKGDDAYKFAEMVGTIDSVALTHAMGGATFGMTHAAPAMRKLNDALFRFNGMEQWNTSMRVGATEAAVNFLLKHGEGTTSPHSKRWLAELGLRPADIKVQDGNLVISPEAFVKEGMSQDQALAASNKMKFAINRWVDGAVLRPDASQKPIWANDPHFKFIAHMKQFAFAFQETTLKRVMHEAQHANYGPAMALASYIPVMMAADMAKGLIQGGGSQPEWRQNWELGDYLESATQRAGLFGVGQFGIDAVKSMHHGGYGVGALGGPSVNHLSDLAMAAGGQRGFQNTVVDSLPANSLWGNWIASSEPGAAPTELVTAD